MTSKTPKAPKAKKPYRRRSKFGVFMDAEGKARRTVDGRLFASQKEADRYVVLREAQADGEITDLKVQGAGYALICGGARVATYIPDFTYYDADGNFVVEDCKGVRTPLYKLKARMVKALYHITILET